jgi:MFS family permease
MVTETTGKSSEVGVWKSRPFQILWSGRFISDLGDQVYLLALPWLILNLTHSATATNIMRMVGLLPDLLFGLVIGIYVERLNRKQVMFVALCIQAALITCIPLLYAWRLLDIAVLYSIGFLLGLALRFYLVAIDTVMPVLFKRQRLAVVNAQLGIADTISQIIGPGLAGLAIGIVGTMNALLFDSFSFMVLALAILLVPIGGYTISRQKSVGLKNANQEAFKWLVQKSGALWAATLGIIALNLFHVGIMPLLIFYTGQRLHFSAQLLGIVFVVGSLGGVAAGFLLSILTSKLSKGKLSLYVMIPMGGAVMLLGVANSWWSLGLLFALDQFGKAVWNACYFAIRQGDTPQELLGRIASTTSMLTKVPSLALPLWGWLADTAGVEAPFLASGLGILVVAGLLSASSLRKTA